MAFQAFDYERIRTRWNVFQTRDVRTKLDIYVFIWTLYYQQLHPRMETYQIKTYISNLMPTTCFWNKLHQVRWKLKVTHITNNIDNKHTLSVTQRSNRHKSIAVIWFQKNIVLLIVYVIVIFLGNWSLLTSYEQTHSFYVLL